MVTFQDALRQGSQMLAQADIQGSRFEAQVLLGEVANVDRARLFAYPDTLLTAEQMTRYLSLLERRAQHEPIAYLLGHKEFYGLDLLVDARVLIPRPETELLVETALEHISARLDRGQIPLVADIGTGSGAIPISIAVEEPRLPVLYACDISEDALAVTQSNSERYHVEKRVKLLQGSLLQPLPEPVDILLANLPYVGTAEIPEMTADVLDYEPSLALFSGTEGLDLLFQLCTEAKQSAKLHPGGVMLLEIGYRQGEILTRFLQNLWPQANISCKKDFAGWDRLMQVVLR